MKFKQKDTIHFLEKLELYIGAGLPLNAALKLIAEGLNNKEEEAMLNVIRAVESGGLLSQALTTELQISPTLAGLVDHGESSGRLSEALLSSRLLLERQDDLKKKCLSAILYPCVIGLFAGLLTIGLIRGVMPQIIPMLKSLNVTLPLLTRMVIGISDGFLQYGLLIFLSAAGLIIAGNISYRKSYSFKAFCQNILLKMPIVGGLIYKYSVSTFMRSCGSLVESGLPITTSYEKTVTTIALLPLRKNLAAQTTEINRGIRFSQIIKEAKVPSFVSSLVAAGETSGTLGSSLLRVASIVDRDIEHLLKRFTALIEPIMMAGMGIVVGAIALSIMMPIYDISRVLQK